MAYKYAYQGPEEGVAKAASTDLPISTKTAVMLADFVRGKTVQRAERDLQEVLKKRTAVPFTRFSEGAGHKPGIGPGKYPQKATKAFLTLVRSVRANAADRGLGDELVIIGVAAHRGARQPNYGRHRGRMGKSTHVEMIVKEAEGSSKDKPAKKAAAKKAPAKEEKPEKQAPQDKPAKEEKPEKQAPQDKPAKEEKPEKQAPKDKPAQKEASTSDKEEKK